MKNFESSENRNELTHEERDLILKTSAEFLQADRKELIQWVLNLLLERGRKNINSMLSRDNGEEKVAFIGYLYQKPKEEREKIVNTIMRLPSHNGFPGIGGHHEILNYLEPFMKMIDAHLNTETQKYFIKEPIF
jgi:hypothetical protein